MEDKESINLGTNNLLLRLAISGKMGSGKSTLADAMVYEFRPFSNTVYARVYSFAEKLKGVAIDVYGMDRDPVNKDRILLQTLGDKMRSVVGNDGVKRENVWIDYLLRKMDKDEELVRQSVENRCVKYKHLQVIDDLRYKNEYDILKANGFMMVRIWADEATRIRRMGINVDELRMGALHKSETDLDSKIHWDYIIDNNGTLEDLADRIKGIFELSSLLGNIP